MYIYDFLRIIRIHVQIFEKRQYDRFVDKREEAEERTRRKVLKLKQRPPP